MMLSYSGRPGQNEHIKIDVSCDRSSRYRIKLCFNTPKPRRVTMIIDFEKKRFEIKIKGYVTGGIILL